MPSFGTERRRGNKGIKETNRTNGKKIMQTKRNKACLKQVSESS
jgi:hypothetical protein